MKRYLYVTLEPRIRKFEGMKLPARRAALPGNEDMIIGSASCPWGIQPTCPRQHCHTGSFWMLCGTVNIDPNIGGAKRSRGVYWSYVGPSGLRRFR